eukprot:7389873-Prymnesium_polylepis.2
MSSLADVRVLEYLVGAADQIHRCPTRMRLDAAGSALRLPTDHTRGRCRHHLFVWFASERRAYPPPRRSAPTTTCAGGALRLSSPSRSVPTTTVFVCSPWQSGGGERSPSNRKRTAPAPDAQTARTTPDSGPRKRSLCSRDGGPHAYTPYVKRACSARVAPSPCAPRTLAAPRTSGQRGERVDETSATLALRHNVPLMMASYERRFSLSAAFARSLA